MAKDTKIIIVCTAYNTLALLAMLYLHFNQ